MNFKFLFLIPSQEKVYGMKILAPYPPLGVLYTASVLERIGVDVKILDMDIDGLDNNKLLSYIKEFKPDIIGLSATTPVIKEVFMLSDIIKKHFSVPIMLGGIHPTMNPEDCIRYPSIDFVVKGEGEDTVKEVVSEMLSGSNNFSNVKGLLYKNGKDFYFTGERDLIKNLDDIPFPSRHLLANFSRYKPPDAEYLPVASIMTTRGCIGKCTYCCTKNIFQNRYRMRSIGNVVEEIDEIIKRFKAREIHIADDALNVNKKRTLELCEAIRRKRFNVNFEFLNGLRADMIDQELLDAFKSIGIKNLSFGAESGDRDILRGVKKDIMPEVVERAVCLAKKNGFKTWVFFIFGLPCETHVTIKNTIGFAKRLDPDFAKFLIFKPFPGSEIHYELKKKSLIDSFDYSRYGVYTPPVHHLEGLSQKDLTDWQKKAFRQFYFRPKKIWDHIKRQKSIAQLKLTIKGFLFVCFNAFKTSNPLTKKKP